MSGCVLLMGMPNMMISHIIWIGSIFQFQYMYIYMHWCRFVRRQIFVLYVCIQVFNTYSRTHMNETKTGIKINCRST